MASYAQDYSSSHKRAIKYYEQALDLYKTRQYRSANELLDKALEKDAQFIECYLLKAEMHQASNQLEQVVENYKIAIAINEDFFPYLRYNLGDVCWRLGKYAEAKENFEQFLSKGKGKKAVLGKAKASIDKCKYALQLVNNPVEFNPKPLPERVNRFYSQYFPSFSIDGKTMVFTALLPDSNRITARGHVPYQEDFYYSIDSSGEWSYAHPLPGRINTLNNEGAQQISADGKTLVFTGCNRRGGFGRCDLYFSYLKNGVWTEPKNAGGAINTNHSEKQPSLSPDGMVLYFSSNRPGGFGGMDLYCSIRMPGGTWSKPRNMDSLINTPGDDVCPFIHPDNQTLYFSSDGHPGLGMKDIFLARKTDAGFSSPENLGYPINTNGDEISLVVDAKGTTAYYAGDNEAKERILYSFEMPGKLQPQPVSYITGRIINAETKKPVAAQLHLFKHQSIDTLMNIETTLPQSSYLLALPSGEDYVFHAKAKGFLFHSEYFELKNSHSSEDPKVLDIALQPLKIGNKVVLKNIFFAKDDYSLDAKSDAELQGLLTFLNVNPEVSIEISGHTDNSGTTTYNQELSENRALEVVKYLETKGVDKQRLTYKGYGETQPVANNETKEGQAQNRRTELMIIGK
jgi:outer membrane protein OmpA-like peptidoglycan-associated protein